MLSRNRRAARAARTLALAAASTTISTLIAGSATAQQFSLQHANSIDLSPAFFGGEPASEFGTNPLSVAFNGTHALVGGFNGSVAGPGNAGFVRVNNPLSLTSSLTPLNNTVFTAGAARGVDYMTSDGTNFYAVYDDGTGNGFVRKLDVNGNQLWSVTPGSIVPAYRPSAINIDPLADNGQPALGMIGIGSGRRVALRLSDGGVIYGPSGYDGPLGEIVNPDPSSVNGINLGFTYRAIAFDSQGNVAVTAAGGTSYGVRDTQGGTNFNRFVNLDGTPSRTSPIAVKNNNADPAGFVGQGLGFLEGLGTQTLLAVSERIGPPHELTLSSSVAGVPPITGLDSQDVHLITTSGAVPAGLLNPSLRGNEDGLGAEQWVSDIKGITVGRDANNLPALFVLSYVDRRLDIYNLEPAWNATAGGTWSSSATWVFGVVPAGALDNARFGTAIAGPATITVDGPKTVKVLRFDSPNSYTLSGAAGSITLNSPGTPLIDVLQGNHTVNVPVTLAKDAQVNVPQGNTLSVKRFSGAGLQINSGTVRIVPDGTSAGTSRVTSLQIAGDTLPTARLDITNNAFVVDYDSEDPSPFDTLKAQIIAAYNGGAWNGQGITSSSADASSRGIGFAEAASLATVPAIFGTVDATAVLLRSTRYGDANLDGVVNLQDFNRLAANFGTSGAHWDQGDFNYDGQVNLQDFNRLAANFGLSASPGGPTPDDWAALGAAVPEPATLPLAGLAALSLLRRRRSAARA